MLAASSIASAKLTKYEVTNSKKRIFEFKEVCREMGHKNLIMVDSLSKSKVDCMGNFIKVSDFCAHKYKDSPYLLRGYVDIRKKKVVCHSGENVIVSVSCDKRDGKLCRKKKQGCEKLRSIFAKRHHEIHNSLVKNDSGQNILSCYFSPEIAQKDSKKKKLL